VKVASNVSVSRGQRYVIVLSSASTTGCYGFAYCDELPYKNGIVSISTDGGRKYVAEAGRTLKFYSAVN